MYYTVKKGFVLRQCFSIANVQAAPKDLLVVVGLVCALRCTAYWWWSCFSLAALEGVVAHGSPVESMRYVSNVVTGLTKLELHVGPSTGSFPTPGVISPWHGHCKQLPS